jgi:hypothetical protein
MRARLIAKAVLIPVYALGGLDSLTARRLAGARLAGLAAIAGLSGNAGPLHPCRDNLITPPAGDCRQRLAPEPKGEGFSCGF